MAEPRNTDLKRSFLYIFGDNTTGVKKPTNYIETLLNMLKAYVGTGIVAMGAAFSFGGILLSPILLVAVALTSLHCQHILIRACVMISDKESLEVLPSYAETVKYTFEDSSCEKFQKLGRAGFIVINTFLLVAEYGVDIVYLIFISTHIREFSEAMGWKADYRVWLAILIVPIWFSTFLLNLKVLAPLSLIANVVMWTGIAIMIYYTSRGLESITERPLVTHITRWPKLIGICLFAFEGCTFIINVRMEMKNREHYLTPFGALNMSMLIVLAFYFAMGFMSYWKYGECIKGSMFLNLPLDEKLSQSIKLMIGLAVIVSYTIHMYVPFEIAYPVFHKKYGPFKRPYLVMNLYKSFWVILTYVIANIDNSIDSFIGLVGGITGTMVTLIMPASLDLALLYGNLTPWRVIKNVLIILIAILGAISSTYFSVFDIISHIKSTMEKAHNETCKS